MNGTIVYVEYVTDLFLLVWVDSTERHTAFKLSIDRENLEVSKDLLNTNMLSK